LPDTEVVVLTGDASADMVTRAFEAGAKAFILKMDSTSHLVEAVKMAGAHRFYLTPETHQSLHFQKSSKTEPTSRKAAAPQALTPREREAVQLLAEGKSNKEVAGVLGISVKTVETHRATIMRKLRLSRLSDLVRYAIRHKIINP
jgi:DNA-binding NarL/FixJ family response regulator